MDDEKVIPAINNGGLFIREYILNNGPASAWELWKAWRDFKRSLGRKGPTYQSFWQNYIYPLRTLGLLVVAGTEPAEYANSKTKVLLDVNHARIDEDAWFDPKAALYGREIKKVRPVEVKPKELIEEYEKKRKPRKAKKETGKRGRKKKVSGVEKKREFLKLYYEQPPEGWERTPVELRREHIEVEEKLKKAEKKVKKKRGRKKRKSTTVKRKAKKGEEKQAQTTKKAKKSKGKKETQKAPKRRKKATKKAEEKTYMTVEELMAELSPEERELLRRLAGRG